MDIDALPGSIQNTFGALRTSKGVIEGVPVHVWDAVPLCREDCPVYEECTYSKSGRCQVQMKYLKQQFLACLTAIPTESFNQTIATQLGFQLMPLFGHLVKFKLQEKDLSRTTYMTDKGTIKVHPIYKEIRETIKTINAVWNNIMGVKGGAPILADPNRTGDADYVDALYEVEDDYEEVDVKPRKVVKLKRKKKANG